MVVNYLLQKSETVAKNEFIVSGKGLEEKQMHINCIRQEFTKLDFEKPHKDNFSISQRGQNQQRQCKVPLSEGQHFGIPPPNPGVLYFLLFF